MDKYLFSSASVLLVLQVFYLLGDLNVIPYFNFSNQQSHTLPVGEIEITQNNVRRKKQQSIVWEDSSKKDKIYNYDSILTLQGSSATLNLNNKSKLKLHENTLIVLEPTDPSAENSSIKLTFQRGLLKGRSSTGFLLESKSWSINADAGSELSIRTVNDDELELEVSGGSVGLKNIENNQVVKVEKNQRLRVNQEKTVEVKNISEQLHWLKDELKEYSHTAPVTTHLKWTGKASKLRLIDPQQKIITFDLNHNKQEHQLQLEYGQYIASLENNNSTSQSLIISIVPSPRIKYFSPLPRDRIRSNNKNYFSWTHSDISKNYILEIAEDREFKKVKLTKEFSHFSNNIQLPEYGRVFWRVSGVDADGFSIPSHYYNELYIIDDPLAAPELVEPELRVPASKTDEQPVEKSNEPAEKSSWLNKIYNLIFPSAYAQLSTKVPVLFKWKPVDGATFYTIEVSTEPDFESLVLNVNTPDNTFEWIPDMHGIYYWRVAGGNVKKLGIFSNLQKINTKELRVLTASVGAGLKPVELKPVVKIPPPKKLMPIQQPVKTQTVEPMTVEAEVPVAKPTTQVHWDFATLGAYQFSYLSNSKDNFKSSLSGGSTLGVKVHAKTNIKEIPLTMNFEYLPFTWKAKSVSSLPFQGSLNDSVLQFNVSSFDFAGYTFGLEMQQINYLQRLSYETIQLKKLNMFGATMHWSVAEEKTWKQENYFKLLVGGSGYSLTYGYGARNHFKQIGKVKMYFFPLAEGTYMNTSDISDYYHLRLKFYIGVNW